MRDKCGHEKREVLVRMAALADQAGEAALARDIRERLRKLEKKAPAVSSDVAVGIRTARLQREHVANAERDRVAQEDREIRGMNARVKLAEELRKKASTEARTSLNEAKKLESTRKMKALTATARDAKKQREDHHVSRCYATEVYDKLGALSAPQRKAMLDAACRRLASLEAKKISLPRQLPSCWPDGTGKKELRKIVAPGSTAGGDVYASEPFM